MLKKLISHRLPLSHIWPCNCAARLLKKVTHIKGRLLDQAVILFNWKWELLLRKEFAPRGSELFPLWAVPYTMEITFTTLGDPPWMLQFLLHTSVTGGNANAMSNAFSITWFICQPNDCKMSKYKTNFAVSVFCGLGRDDLLALLCVMFSCVLSLSHMVFWVRVRCGTLLYWFLIVAFFLTFTIII